MSQIVWNIFPLSSGWISHLTLFLLGVTVTQVSCYSFWKQTPPFFLLQCISFFPHVLPLPLHGLPRISISITKWNCPTFLCVNVTKIFCTIYQLLLNGHSTLFLHFLCVDCHTFFVSFFVSELPYISFDFSVELSYLILCDCHTNFMSLLLKVYSSLLPSKPLIPLSCVDCHIFSSHFIVWNCTILLWVIVTQISCFVSWLFLRIHFTSFILCMDCHTFLLYFLSGHYTCHTSFSHSW